MTQISPTPTLTYSPSSSPFHANERLHVIGTRSMPPPGLFVERPPQLPSQRYIPLPPETLAQQTPRYLFPFDLNTEISAWTLAQLSTIVVPPYSTIHVHDPTIHVGDIQAHDGSTGRNIVEYIHFIVRSPLTYTAYHELSENMKESVKAAFFRRRNTIYEPWHRRLTWEAYVRGEGPGPTGADLLLGKTVVWGLNPDPRSWRWVLHVADNSQNVI